MTKLVKPEVESFARIRVVGVGGSGGNAVNHMVSSHVAGVDFIAVNTDGQDLHKNKAKRKIHMGKALTRGLGTGMNADLGKQAADESREEIQDALKGSDMVFVTCGMGGGTGTGAAPVVAKIARELGALTVGVVTKPFGFEGAQRARLAEQGLSELRKAVDAMIVIPNDKLLTIVTRETGIKNAFAMCDDILKQAVEGISDIITQTGIINVDFADVRAVMQNAGSALMGIGMGIGEKRSELAARAAINSPLLDVSIHGAKGVLFSIAGGEDLGMLEVQDAANVITDAIDPDAKVIFGAVTDPSLKKGAVRVTVIATGFPEAGARSSLFGAAQRFAKKDQDVPPATLREREEKKSASEKAEREKQKKEPVRVATEDEDEGWGGLPSFLRRR
ncbi:cell division protein FtsZ [Candidatus Kaiserbacteria bacterium RIFCSPLOWO2_01_FULL_54_13]|uniref:Cell division protein FtsZ n=1 Tax=Candidatus Kaiserbacteria bacterium RIFCSPLOWO2_01_FULL_54_13 TaxID=1798512 RepID=A0A1F6F1U6_9BACT|nr:MAG: cell division protein FtsZ [Candidatus Kaiserbacteria bacterium RIFCSPLOWO2_01_FULL_54_13]